MCRMIIYILKSGVEVRFELMEEVRDLSLPS